MTRPSWTRGRRPFLAPGMAAAVYGMWTLFCNRHHGTGIAVRAGLVQAATSFVATLLMLKVTDRLFRFGASPLRGLLICVVCIPLISLGVLYIPHALAQTPSMMATIAPPLVVGTVFLISYSIGLYISAGKPPLETDKQ